MKTCTGFWVGMSAGLVAGAAVGMMTPYGRDSMKTQVGKSIHKLGDRKSTRLNSSHL